MHSVLTIVGNVRLLLPTLKKDANGMREGRVLSGIRPSYLSDKAVIINIKTNRIMSMSCELDRRSDRLFESYERFSELSNEELQFALRIVHRELEKKWGERISDDLFIDLYKKIKSEFFIHPAGPWSGLGAYKCYDSVLVKIYPDTPRPNGICSPSGRAAKCHRFFKEYFTNFDKEE